MTLPRQPYYRNDTQLASIMVPISAEPINPCLCLTSASSAYWDSIGEFVETNSGNWNSSISANLWNESYNVISSNSGNWNDLLSAWNTTSGLFLQNVFTDNTLSGSGTSASPIGLSLETKEAIFGDTRIKPDVLKRYMIL